jgi:hypothetical protein
VTITEFLTARLDEDEAVARAASPGPWHPNAELDEVLAMDGITVADGFALSGPQTRATTEHIARHDPARVLADVEAKRRIVERLTHAIRRHPGATADPHARWRHAQAARLPVRRSPGLPRGVEAVNIVEKILTAFGLQYIDTAAKEHAELDRLRLCTNSDEQYLATLHQAVLIAQCGGITDEKLEALLALGATGVMLPGTEEALHKAGIDTRPWAVVSEEWKAGRP